MATEDEIRAQAVREAALYLERITRRGLISQRTVLADLEAVAGRMEQGMTARGSTRTVRGPQIAAQRPCGATNPQIAGGHPCIQDQGHAGSPHVSMYGGRAYEWMPGGR